MREGSALLERLEKRFESIDSRADRRSVGMRLRDSFLSQFSDRMKQLERLVQVPEMSAFRRLPKSGRAFDPWGNMGGWSVVQDLTYLEWLAEQEVEEEEIEQPRVSAWGTATSSATPRRNSAWLNTPYTPARVAGKPLPKPQAREVSRRGRPVKRQKTPVEGLSSRRTVARAPTLSPLKRAMGRATVAQERRSSNARVMNSLPPVLSKTTGQSWMDSKQKAASTRSVSSTLRSPMFKMVSQEMKSTSADADLSPSVLASKRLSTPTKANLLSRDTGQVSEGLRSSTSRGLRISASNSIRATQTSTASSASMDAELQAIVRRQVIKATEANVPTQVSKSVASVVNASTIQRVGKAANVTAEVVEIIENLVLKEAQSQIEDIFQAASIGSLEQLTESTGTVQASVRRVRTIVNDVVKQIVIQAEKSGLVDRTVQEQMGGSVDANQVQTSALTRAQKKTIVQRLQSKGIRRQRAERILESISASRQDVRYSVDTLLDQVLESTDSAEGRPFSKKVLERQVRRQLTPLMSQSTSSPLRSVSKSVLPRVVGEQISERVIADVVNEIAAFAERETLVENSEGQRQLISSLERTVSKLVTQTRMPKMSDVDWVDVQPYSQDLGTEVEGDLDPSQRSVSPWFTREESSEASEKRSLKPMQQAAARVLRMVSTNPTRPEVVARQTGLKLQEVQQIVDSIQGFTTTDIPVSSMQSDMSEVIQLIANNPTRPEVVARQTGLNVQDVQQLVSRFSNEARAESGGVDRTTDKQAGSALSQHPLDHLWERATSPIALPEWKGMGTTTFKPMIGESAKAWRLSPKRRAVHPYSVDVDSTVLQATMDDADALSTGESDGSKPSPWLSRKDTSVAGFGFVPQTISGDAKLSSNEIAMFGGQAKSVQLSIGDVQGRRAHWLEPNRTVVLDNGTVIHAKMAKRLGLDVKASSKENLPLSWTLEGLQLKSDHKSLPTWAQRASGKPQVKASPEFLVALAKASSAEDVAEVILQNSGRSQDGILPKTAMTAIDQIRREAHRSLQDMVSAQQEIAEYTTARTGRDRTRRRVSRTARAVADGLTGLRPISTAAPASSGEAQVSDKISKLTRQLESLVSLAEDNRRDEARQGVRMAEDSHDAIAEGHVEAQGEARDYAVDIEALRQEVMRAFEQEMSIRSLRSFENQNNTDPWW